jgi:hypothetical protein
MQLPHTTANGESWPASDLAVSPKSMTGTKGDIKWSAIRQSQRHRCRTDGWVFLIAMRSKQARYKCSNSATGVSIPILLSCDTTRRTAMTPSALQTASPAMTSVDARVPDQVPGTHPLPWPVDCDEVLAPLAFATPPGLGPMEWSSLAPPFRATHRP